MQLETPVRVIKRLQAAGGHYQPGDVLDASGWPPNRLNQLLRSRYVQLVTSTASVSGSPRVDADSHPPRRRRGRPRKSEVTNGA